MARAKEYIVARSAKGRPTLMHVLAFPSNYETICGIDVSAWSRAYSARPITQILCKRCAALNGNKI